MTTENFKFRRELREEKIGGIKVFKRTCYLGDTIDKKNYDTKHRIIAKSLGGVKAESNHALLSVLNHEEIHIMQYMSPKQYAVVTRGLQQFKETKDMKCLEEVRAYFRQEMSKLLDVKKRRLKRMGQGYEWGGKYNK